jgi:hypothetical protein
MHLGERVLPHQPPSTVGRYGGYAYSNWTSKAYGQITGERWIFKAGGVLYRPIGFPGNTPRYHGAQVVGRVVLWEDQPMMILSRPLRDMKGKVVLLPLGTGQTPIEVNVNPLDLPLADCPTCEDIAKFLRIKGLTGTRVQNFIDIEFVRLAKERQLDIFSTEED